MKRVFLLGHPLGHSVSPAMQNAAFRALGLNWEYELFDIAPEQLARAVARLRADDCAGANVTLPYKVAVMDWLDALTPEAQRVGAVNTIFKRSGTLMGTNTDVYGIEETLRQAMLNLSGRPVAILGAGGAARSAAFALAGAGAASVTLLNRTVDRAERLADCLQAAFPALDVIVNSKTALTRADLIVNATSVGMMPNASASPMPCAFPGGAIAFDLVYRPLETRFLKEAARAGAQTIDGMGMLVHQGAAALNTWTGRPAPVERMFATVRSVLEQEERCYVS